MPVKVDKRPLLSYLKVQKDFDEELAKILRVASQVADREIRALVEKNGIGARIQRERLLLIRKNLLIQQAELWKEIGAITKAGQSDAAAAAIETNFSYHDALLRRAMSETAVEGLLASVQASARRTVSVVTARLQGLSARPLASSVYNAKAWSDKLLIRTINDALARGLTARELAANVRDLIRPDVRGGVSYAAQRLGRTELNNAFHAVAVQDAINNPIITGMEWHLSGSHKKPDECNDLAGQVFPPAEVPAKPHPQCFCYVTPEVPDRDTFMRNFFAGQYDSYISS